MIKIILALMMITSFAFADTCYSYTGTDSQYLEANSASSCYVSYNGFDYVRIGVAYGGQTNQTTTPLSPSYLSSSITVSSSTTIQLTYYYMVNWIVGGLMNYKYVSYQINYKKVVASDCPLPNVIINGQCSAPSVPQCSSSEERLNGVCVPSCDQLASSFRTPSGECQDCITSTSFSGRSSCACDSQGSTYTPQSVMSIDYTTGNYTYKKTNITCDNGTRIAIYTDPKNNNPQDYNSTYKPNDTAPSPENNSTTTTPIETNTTTTPATNNDVVEALKAINDGTKEVKTALGEVGTNVKAMNDHLANQGTTFNEILSKIKEGNAKGDATYQLMDTEFKGQAQMRNKLGQWIDADLINATSQLGATNGVKNAVDGTTTAVNTQGKNITDKLDDVIKAIGENNNTGKDGNGTDLTKVEEKLDKLHDDNNKTHSLLDTLNKFFDNNDSFKAPDLNSSENSFSISELLPDASFFETNKLKLNFNNYKGACYCETVTFVIANKSFVFPPPELLALIPFTAISNLFMALLFMLGLRDFLRNN